MSTHTVYESDSRPYIKRPRPLLKEQELKQDVLILESLCFADSDFESYNSFLNEWGQLLLNAIVLFKAGYFDCAYYSLRQAIELAITVLYFHDVDRLSRNEIVTRWSNKQSFPSFKRILDELKMQEKYKDIINHLPFLFGDLSSFQKKLHKIIHKQGYFYLYTIQNHPMIIPNNSQKEFITNFEEYFKNTLKQMLVIRLLIDPIPVLLSDSRVQVKRLYLSMPLPAPFISKYLGLEFIEKYKQTQLYNKYPK